MEVEFQTDSPRRLLPRGLGFDMPRARVRVHVSRVAHACLRHETLCGVAPCVARQVSRTLSESFDFAVITFMVEVLFFEQPLEVRAADGTINREPHRARKKHLCTLYGHPDLCMLEEETRMRYFVYVRDHTPT